MVVPLQIAAALRARGYEAETWFLYQHEPAFENEPGVHEGLPGLPNVVLAPHAGSATRATRTAMARLCAEAIAAVLSGRPAPNLLNPEVVTAR